MFASVLEVSPPYSEEENNENSDIICTDDAEQNTSITTTATTVPQDTTKIIVLSDSQERVKYISQDSHGDVTPQDNKVVISNNLGDQCSTSSVSSTELLPKTVIVIKNGDDSAGDNNSKLSATRDGSDDGSNYNSAELAKQVIIFNILKVFVRIVFLFGY